MSQPRPSQGPLPVLAYGGPTVTPRTSRLVRLGGGCGLLGVAMALLLVPVLRSGRQTAGLYIDATNDYRDWCAWWLMPCQCAVAAVGGTLTVAGCVRMGRRRTAGYLIAFTLNVLAFGITLLEYGYRPSVVTTRWTTLHNTF